MRFIFSLIPLYGVLAAIGVFAMGTGSFNTEHMGGGYVATTFVILLVIAVFGIIPTIVSIFEHVSQLGRLQEEKEEVENNILHCDAIKKHIEMVTNIATEIDAEILAKSNVDHPIVKAMQELTRAESDLRYARNKVAGVKSKIAARKRGPYRWVVSMYGEE